MLGHCWIFLCPIIFLCFFKNLCSENTSSFEKPQKNVRTLSFLPWFDKKNIEKVWDIEKLYNLAKFRKKIKPKTAESKQVFRWTRLYFALKKSTFRSLRLLEFFKFSFHLAKKHCFQMASVVVQILGRS